MKIENSKENLFRLPHQAQMPTGNNAAMPLSVRDLINQRKMQKLNIARNEGGQNQMNQMGGNLQGKELFGEELLKGSFQGNNNLNPTFTGGIQQQQNQVNLFARQQQNQNNAVNPFASQQNNNNNNMMNNEGMMRNSNMMNNNNDIGGRQIRSGIGMPEEMIESDPYKSIKQSLFFEYQGRSKPIRNWADEKGDNPYMLGIL